MTIPSVFSADGPLQSDTVLGTKDGLGGADHDQSYTFGRRPRAMAPFPFNERQYARLLRLRGCIGDGLRCDDDLGASGVTFLTPSPESQPDEVARAILHSAGVLGG